MRSILSPATYSVATVVGEKNMFLRICEDEGGSAALQSHLEGQYITWAQQVEVSRQLKCGTSHSCRILRHSLYKLNSSLLTQFCRQTRLQLRGTDINAGIIQMLQYWRRKTTYGLSNSFWGHVDGSWITTPIHIYTLQEPYRLYVYVNYQCVNRISEWEGE